MIKEKEINPYAFYIFMAVTQPTMRAWVMKTYRKNQSACDGMSGRSVDEQARAFFRSRTPGLYCEMIKAVKVAEFVGLADFCKRLMQSYPEHNQVKKVSSFAAFMEKIHWGPTLEANVGKFLLYCWVREKELNLPAYSEEDLRTFDHTDKLSAVRDCADSLRNYLIPEPRKLPKLKGDMGEIARSASQDCYAEAYEDIGYDSACPYASGILEMVADYLNIAESDFLSRKPSTKELETYAVDILRDWAYDHDIDPYDPEDWLRALGTEADWWIDKKEDIGTVIQKSTDEVLSRTKLFKSLQPEAEEKKDELFQDMIQTLSEQLDLSVLFWKLGKLYSDARDCAMDLVDENAELKRKLLGTAAAEPVHPTLDEDSCQKLLQEKQAQLNQMQIRMDKLQLSNQKQAEELEAYKHLLQAQDDSHTAEPEGEPEPVNREFPKGSVLVGGHPRWQKFFAQGHKDVKILDGSNASLHVETISASTPLVLVNTTHMCHGAYQKLQNVLQRTGVPWEFIYPRYRGSGRKRVEK